MIKTSQIQTSKFAREREQLVNRLTQLLTEARDIEDALGVATRILPEPSEVAPSEIEVVGAPQGAATFEEPRGKIMRKVWEYMIANPGQTSVELRKALRLEDVAMATALNTLLRKNGQVQVRGRRGAYRYYAVTAKK
jgi:hypothetical protein